MDLANEITAEEVPILGCSLVILKLIQRPCQNVPDDQDGLNGLHFNKLGKVCWDRANG